MSWLRAVDRRAAIAGALTGATALSLPRGVSAGRVVVQRGMVGGGLVEFEKGEAHFSFFASRLIEEDNQEVIVGSVIWVDATVGLTMTSTAVTAYIVPEAQPDQGVTRRIVGTMSVNEDEYPFQLVVTDVDLPGTGLDTVDLTVGDAVNAGELATPAAGSGFSYVAAGPVVSGDIQEVDIDIELHGG
jgi:hypothetical protein